MSEDRAEETAALKRLRHLLDLALARADIALALAPAASKAAQAKPVPVPSLTDGQALAIQSDPHLFHAFNRLVQLAERPTPRSRPLIARLLAAFVSHATWRHDVGAIGPMTRRLRRRLGIRRL